MNRFVTAALMTSTLILTACSGGQAPPDGDVTPVMTADHVVIVAGSHANAPRPVLSPQASSLVETTMAKGGDVDLLIVSGAPEFVDLSLKQVKGTDAGKEATLKGNLKRIDKALMQGPNADGSDLVESTALATAKLRAAQSKSPLIIIADSGLTDSGRLQLTMAGMLGADPGEVARFLTSTNGLADMTGITVLLSGLGYTTAPQQPLDDPLRTRVNALWATVFEAAGAKVERDTEPNTGDSVQTAFTVRPVTLPATPTPPAPCSTDEIVFDAQSAVSFAAEEDNYVDATAARRALAPVAAWLGADPRRTAFIRGTTANDLSAPTRLEKLGQLRADAVARDLVAMGARTEQVTTKGVGSAFPEYVMPDRDPVSGELLPAAASLNRSVRVALDAQC